MSMNLSRRGFMKGAAALAAVSAMSGVLAGCSGNGGVSGVGVTRTFGNNDISVSLTSTDFDIVSIPGGAITVIPAFTVVNNLGASLKITDSEDDITTDDTYGLVIKATFDGKLPEALPADLPDYGAGTGDDVSALFNSNNLNGTDVAKSKTAKGVLCFTAPFKNWNRMDMTVALYKKSKDAAAQKLGTTTFTFRQ